MNNSATHETVLWAGVLTAADGACVFLTYRNHQFGMRDRTAYAVHEYMDRLFVQNLKNSARHGLVISESRIREDSASFDVDKWLSEVDEPMESTFRQSWFGEYNRSHSGPTVELKCFEPTRNDEFEFLLNSGFIDEIGGPDHAYVYYVGRGLSNILDKYLNVRPDMRPSSHEIRQEADRIMEPFHQQLFDTGLFGNAFRSRPMDLFEDLYFKIYGALPDLKPTDENIRFWQAVTCPWRHPQIARELIPHPLNKIAHLIFEKRDQSVVRGAIDGLNGGLDVAIAYGPEHCVQQITLLIQRLANDGREPQLHAFTGKARVLADQMLDLLAQRKPFGKALRDLSNIDPSAIAHKLLQSPSVSDLGFPGEMRRSSRIIEGSANGCTEYGHFVEPSHRGRHFGHGVPFNGEPSLS